MSEHEEERDRYFLALLSRNIPPSEMNNWTVDQFDLARRWFDQEAKEAAQ